MKRLIKGGRIINPADNTNMVGDILIENDQIVEIGENLRCEGAEVFQADGLIVAPGFIDMHTHLREPGLEAKEDIASGTRAAAAGGFTTIACMANTKPVIDSAILVVGVNRRAQEIGVVHVKPIGAVSKGLAGQELAEIGDMIAAGAVAFSDDGKYISNSQLLRTAMEYISIFDGLLISHAEDETLVEDGVMHEGSVSAMLGMKGRPAVAEDIAVARDLLMAEYVGARIHIAHVSTKGAVELIRKAKERGVRVTAETTPHHLYFTDEALTGFNTAFKVNPPLRSAEHVAAVREGLRDGTIDVIATDHAPHAFEEKDVEFRYAPSGFPGLETALGVILTTLYHSGFMSLQDLVARMSSAPARILGLEAGTLQVGHPADIVIFDPDQEWQVDPQNFWTKARHSPFEGVKLKGKAIATIVAGKFVMCNGEVLQ
ncbi:MAG: pyrC 2 [Firmicutes bacterium]|nr:pyrC 2 [Bacillota bacterium]